MTTTQITRGAKVRASFDGTLVRIHRPGGDVVIPLAHILQVELRMGLSAKVTTGPFIRFVTAGGAPRATFEMTPEARRNDPNTVIVWRKSGRRQAAEMQRAIVEAQIALASRA